MDLATLIQKVMAFIAKAKAATTWLAKLQLIPDLLALIADIAGMFPIISPAPPGPVMMATAQTFMATCEAKTDDELLADLECECNKNTAVSATMMTTNAKGPVIDVLLPILLALLRKWLGL